MTKCYQFIPFFWYCWYDCIEMATSEADGDGRELEGRDYWKKDDQAKVCERIIANGTYLD
jgi:hypothetical protein